MYEEALRKAGHNITLNYNPDPNFGEVKNKNKRKREVIWFNPPYDKGVKTNVGKEFLNIIREAFPPHTPFIKY